MPHRVNGASSAPPTTCSKSTDTSSQPPELRTRIGAPSTDTENPRTRLSMRQPPELGLCECGADAVPSSPSRVNVRVGYEHGRPGLPDAAKLWQCPDSPLIGTCGSSLTGALSKWTRIEGRGRGNAVDSPHFNLGVPQRGYVGPQGISGNVVVNPRGSR